LTTKKHPENLDNYATLLIDITINPKNLTNKYINWYELRMPKRERKKNQIKEK